MDRGLETLRMNGGVDAVRIPLRDRSGDPRAYALIGREDLPLICRRRWHLTSQGYARSNRPGGGFDYLHRFLLGLRDRDGHEVDHINRDKLDNRRSNLRLADHAGNGQNKGAVGRSPLRGVAWDRATGKWRASVKVNGVRRNLGRFSSEQEAGAVSAAARRRLMPLSEEARDA